MNPIKAGQIWRQNDGSRTVRIRAIGFTTVAIENTKTFRNTRVDLMRFNSKRKNGFTLLHWMTCYWH